MPSAYGGAASAAPRLKYTARATAPAKQSAAAEPMRPMWAERCCPVPGACCSFRRRSVNIGGGEGGILTHGRDALNQEATKIYGFGVPCNPLASPDFAIDLAVPNFPALYLFRWIQFKGESCTSLNLIHGPPHDYHHDYHHSCESRKKREIRRHLCLCTAGVPS
jgi:hypothetical protein